MVRLQLELPLCKTNKQCLHWGTGLRAAAYVGATCCIKRAAVIWLCLIFHLCGTIASMCCGLVKAGCQSVSGLVYGDIKRLVLTSRGNLKALLPLECGITRGHRLLPMFFEPLFQKSVKPASSSYMDQTMISLCGKVLNTRGKTNLTVSQTLWYILFPVMEEKIIIRENI